MRIGGGILALAMVACSISSAKPDPRANNNDVPFRETRAAVAIPGATVHRAIAYVAESRTQRLDLFVPEHGTPPFPLVIRIHGGGFDVGSARTAAQGAVARQLVGAGYALATVSYRPTAEAPFPAAARDVKAAVRFLRASAPRWELDSTRFAVWGESSGGWLAVMLGVTGDQPTVFDDPSLGNANVSSAVQAVVDWYGPVDFAAMDGQHERHPPVACPETYARHTGAGTAESRWLCGNDATSLADPACAPAARAANLASYVATAKKLPPFSIAHGGDDCEVPWWQSAELSEVLRKREATMTYTKVPRAGHGDPQIEATELPRALEMLAAVFKPAR